MTTIREPSAVPAAADDDVQAGGSPWDALYRAMLGQLADYVDLAVARALAAHGIPAPAEAGRNVCRQPAAPAPAPASGRKDKVAGGPGEAARTMVEARLRAPFEAAPLPPWLQPFTMPENVRFTRTPDAILRGEWMPPQAPELERVTPAPEPNVADQRPAAPAAIPVKEPAGIAMNRIPLPKARDRRQPPSAIPKAPAAEPGDAARRRASRAGHDTTQAPEEGSATLAWLQMLRTGRAEALRIADEQDNETDAENPAEGATDADLIGPESAAEDEQVQEVEGAPDDTGEAPVMPAPRGATQVSETATRAPRPHRPPAPRIDPAAWEPPPLDLLIEPAEQTGEVLSSGVLEQNARLLEGVLEEFGVRGEIIDVRPGPVVTLYELEPAPGTKSSRVIGLSDDIARSMSAVSARVAVVQGRNVIGIELPNQRRETVFLRELVGAADFVSSKHKLAIALGKTIGGEPIIVDLARMPHLLVAGTTGSGKSVAINTMILSLLYRFRPQECRLIMIDPKMLELSVYEGIPHLLTPVVTDPKKAVVALKWAVREMEDRYKKMAKVGVRNIDGFNARVGEAVRRGETISRTVQTGFNRETGEPIYDREEMSLEPLPYIVLIVDEMADLMMVAGKDIESAIQRLAQMARAAGIHLITATQRPSVDVITGTIKANFPTRVSFQVTSKIDSRTILGEQGAEQLLGQGDMLYMAGGGRIRRVHGPFVSDGEVEKVVAHLKAQGHPAYLDVVLAEEEAGEPEAEAPGDKPVFDRSAAPDEDGDLYEQAVKVVLRDKKCSTSYIQRRLQVGYNKAASLVERMEKEGLVGQANNAGKREILVYSRDLQFTESRDGDD